jgi:hypothetical protein
MIDIDKDIPIPSKATGNKLRKYPWDELEIGDSFLFPAEYGIKACSTRMHAAAHRSRKKYTSRTTPEGVRCWRIK